MRQAVVLKCAVAAIFALLLVAVPARADLQPVAQFFGKISLSVDAEGNNNLAGGTIRVQKPGGATVRAAFLMANSHGVFGNRTISDGDVTLAGTPISWDRTEFNGIPCCPTFFHNVFANVTSIVQPIIDAAPAGVTNLQVTETGTTQVNGTILVVVFDDPNETTDNSAILLFGGQATGGETFLINFSEPIGAALDRADMGIGIGHGFQGLSGTPMVNVINVNGTRLTSSAGGEDDGESFDGGLITVGGIGDSIANPPDPFAPSAGFRTDDELYDLRPFLTAGDTQIDVFSFNPTGDDNIFFAYFFTSVPSAVLPNVPPPAPRQVVGALDPNLPTIVLIHGLQEDLDPDAVEPLELWSGESDEFDTFPPIGAKHIIENLPDPNGAPGAVLGDGINVIQFVWPEAFQGFSLAGYRTAREYADDAGTALAAELVEQLGDTYDQPIHVVGHSLGTVAGAYAMRQFLTIAKDVSLSQFTILDYPSRRLAIPPIPQDFFATLLQGLQDSRGLRMDNYHSPDITAFGAETEGRIYDHPALQAPNDVGDQIFPAEGDTDHTGVNQWYRWTMEPNEFNATVYCENGTFNRPSIFFSRTLNPCQRGWHWSLFGQGGPIFGSDEFPTALVGDPIVVSQAPLVLGTPREFGCRVDNGTIICEEQSSPFVIFEVEIPVNATYLQFEYKFSNIGDGDYAAVLIDDTPIWVLAGSNVIQQGEFAEAGPIPIGHLAGSRRLTVALFGVGEPNAAFEIRNFTFLSTSTAVSVDIKPKKDPNPVNLRSRDVIPVAILTTDTFDATTVDPLSVEFGPSGAFEAHDRGHIKDVDEDGDLDLMLHFAVRETGISCGDTSASLTGETFGGEAIEGSDSIKTVGCR